MMRQSGDENPSKKSKLSDSPSRQASSCNNVGDFVCEIHNDNAAGAGNRGHHPHSTIQKYLKVEVDPVKLPELEKYAKRYKTYPPLILDGASGVGKTQQAFALLKGGQNQEAQNLIYILLADGAYSGVYSGESQPIYTEMIESTSMTDLRNQIVCVAKDLQTRQAESIHEDDPFSMSSIYHLLGSEHQSVVDLIRNLSSSIIKYNEENRGIQKVDPGGNIGKENLKNIVLFVDEALPSDASESAEQSDTEPSPKHLLQFVRNLGRVLEMRVVLAGTAATAANMWTLPKGSNISRGSGNTMTWAEVEFLYHTIEATYRGRTIPVRPLLGRWISDSGVEKIEDLVHKVTNTKSFSDENKFIWLSGVCLSSNETTSSPFHLNPSALVQGHYFEPALVTYKVEDEGDRIYEGKGFKNTSQKCDSSKRMEIIKKRHDRKLFWLVKETTGQLPVAIGLQYDFVEYALTNCVQVCLAMEPVFAFALSFSQRMDSDDFQKAFGKALPVTHTQRTKGVTDGELHEAVIFAALQLACNPDDHTGRYNNMHTVKQCVEQLHEYLRIEGDNEIKEYNKVAKILQRENFNARPRKMVKGQIDIQPYNGEEFLKRLKEVSSKGTPANNALNMLEQEVKMPWLVPACGEEKLRTRMGELGPDFFGDFVVAGLVPETNTSRMVAHAYCWKSYEESDEKLKPDWAFEFRVRNSSYPPNLAMKDLMKKCQDNEKCHAMLIAVTDRVSSVCKYCAVKIGEESYLRVIVLIGASYS